ALPNTSINTNTCDGNARLLGTWLKNSSGSNLDSSVYVYDPANQRTNLTHADNSSVAFSYDKIGQLTIANSSSDPEDRGYAYDAAWNLHYRTNNGSLDAVTVDNKNELTNAPNVGALTYDLNGNLVSTHASSTREYYSFLYDHE